MHKSAWLLMLLSAGLQILVFPLPNLYFLGWVAVAPLLVALLRAREPDTLQLLAGVKLLPAKPAQAFLLAYCLRNSLVCRNLLLDLQHHAAVRRRGHARRAGAAVSFLPVSCPLSRRLRLADQPAGESDRWRSGQPIPFSRRALLLAPFVWVAVELARTRITGFPWDLLGITRWTIFRWPTSPP